MCGNLKGKIDGARRGEACYVRLRAAYTHGTSWSIHRFMARGKRLYINSCYEQKVLLLLVSRDYSSKCDYVRWALVCAQQSKRNEIKLSRSRIETETVCVENKTTTTQGGMRSCQLNFKEEEEERVVKGKRNQSRVDLRRRRKEKKRVRITIGRAA